MSIRTEQMFTTGIHNKRAKLAKAMRDLAGTLVEHADLLTISEGLTQLDINSPVNQMMQIYRLAVEIEVLQQGRSIIRDE